MLNSVFLFVVVVILLISSVSLARMSFDDLYKKLTASSCEDFISDNSSIWLPKNVSNVFYGKDVILHFSMMIGKTFTVNGVVSNKGIVDLECGRSSDYDFEIWMSDMDALELATSNKPTTTFAQLWDSGNIEIEANGEENEELLSTYKEELVAEDNEPVPSWIRRIFEVYS